MPDPKRRPSLYAHLRDALDPLLRRAGLYSAYTLRGERIGTAANLSLVNEAGYEPLPLGLEAAKRHPDDGRLHVHSARRVDPEHARRQWHVHAFDTPKYYAGFEIHSHYELRPDPWPVGDETVREAYARLREHYRPTKGDTWGDGITYVPGSACPNLWDALD